MNGHRIMVGAILLILCAACVLQGSIVGCSASENPDEAVTDEPAETGTPFFRSAGDDAPSDWREVSDSVLEQISEMPKFSHLQINSIERSESGASAIRCSIGWRANLSEAKQLLDGLLLLHETFPEQNSYIVTLEGGGNADVESDWDTMDNMVEEGYTFDVAGEEARSYWRRFIESDQGHPNNAPTVLETANSR